MALVYKVTKFINKGNSPTTPSDYLFAVEYHDFTLPTPPTQTVQFTIAKSNASDSGSLMDSVDTALGSLGTNEVDWSK